MKRKTFLLLSVTAFYGVLYTLFFSPVVFSNGLLAPGDGYVYYLPNFFSKGFLWEPLIFSGFPVAADPQAMTWYPVAAFFSMIHSWNWFVIMAYVLASCFVCGYVWTVSQSWLAGLASGIVYGMSGFMMSHLGHTSMIHTAVWLPLFIWALEKLRHSLAIPWLLAAVLSLTVGVFAGHPQILLYMIGLGTVYVLIRGFSGAAVGRWRYYGLYLLILVLGLSLASIQLLPANELKDLGMRSHMSFDEFTECSFPSMQVATLLFPYLLGGSPGSLYPPYFGSCNIHELSGYVGLLPLLMAALGLVSYRRKSIVIFWSCIMLFSFLLTLGDATPLARLMYHLPAFNKFRVPARHFLEMSFAVSVLTGFGAAAIQNQAINRRVLLRIIGIGAGVMLLTLATVSLFGHLDLHMLQHGGKTSMFHRINPAIVLPLLLFLGGSCVLVYLHGCGRSYFRQALLVLVLIIDLGSFGWFMQWKYVSPDAGILDPTDLAEKYRGLLDKHNQRLLSLRGGEGDLSEMPPNTAALWGMPGAGGYNPLMLSRVGELLSMKPAGMVSGLWSAEFDHSLDIMAVRYVFMLARDTLSPKLLERSGFSWISDDAPIQLGGCNNPHSDSITLSLPNPVEATAIGIVSAMACSANIKDDAEVVRLQLISTDGGAQTRSMLSGRDTSEWKLDCNNEAQTAERRRATIFESWPVEESGRQCEGHKYLSVIPLRKAEIKSLNLRWVPASGTIGIKKISLLDEPSGRSFPLFAANASLAEVTRWRHAEDFGGTTIYENLRAMPRAWMVPEVVSARPDEVLYAVKASALPDGRPFDPAKTALIEEPMSFRGREDGTATAQVVHIDNTSVEIHTEADASSFLVLSDVYYPGWHATIDGNRTHIFRTDYVLRGVMVPSGGHIVRFEYRPKSLFEGAGISAVSLFVLVGISLMIAAGRRKRSESA